MNIQNKALRVLGTVGGVLFSILLIFALVGSLLFSVTASLTKPETIVMLTKEYSITEQVLEDSDISKALSEAGVPSELVADVMDSPLFKDVVEAYTEEVVAAVQGKQTDAAFNEQKVKQFAEDHMDAIVGIARKYIPKNVHMTDTQIQATVREITDEYAPAIVEAIPTGEQIKEILVETKIEKPAELLVSTTVPVVLYTIIGVLAAIIFVCLLHKFRGLLCLGIDALIVAVFLLAPYLVLANDELLSSLLGESAALIAPLIAVLNTRLGIYLIVLTVVGVLFIAGYITYTALTKKKAATVLGPGVVENPELLAEAVAQPKPETVEIPEPIIEAVAQPLPAEEN